MQPLVPTQRAEGLAGTNRKSLVGEMGLIELLKFIKNQRATQNKRLLAERLRTRRLLAAHRATQNKPNH